MEGGEFTFSLIAIPIGIFQTALLADIAASDTTTAAIISGVFLTINTVLTIVIQKGLSNGRVLPKRRRKRENKPVEDTND